MSQPFYIKNKDEAKIATDYFATAYKGRYLLKASEWRDVRSVEQNRKMWAMLSDVAQQVEWPGGPYSKEDWKDILTASMKRAKFAPGIEGGMVPLGQRTSRMTIAEMTELMDYIEWFGTEKEVTWSNHEHTT